jgi:hypothetical protein
VKNATYISALLGILLVVISLIGVSLGQNYQNLLLPLGIGILLLVSLPLILMQFRDHSKKMKRENKQYHINKKQNKGSATKPNKKSVPAYPSFGERKSGLHWGGGNIHASTAKRGSKKRFLEK